jgi:hypothetical protein
MAVLPTHGVVLGPPAEYLHAAADLVVAADHRIEFALAGQVRQVPAVPLQGLVLLLGVLVLHARPATNVLDRAAHRLLIDGGDGEDLLRLALRDGHRQQQHLGADVGVLELVRLLERCIEDLLQFSVHARLPAADRGLAAQFRIEDLLDLRGPRSNLL